MARNVLNLGGSDNNKDWKAGPSRPEPLPKGWYKVAIYDAEDKETKKDGSPYLRLTLNVLDEGDYYGRTVYDNFVGKYVTERAAFLADKAKSLSAIIGLWDGESDEVTLPAADDVIGVEVEVYAGIEVDKYAMDKYVEENGEEPEKPITQNRFNQYRPVGGWGNEAKAGGKSKKKSITV